MRHQHFQPLTLKKTIEGMLITKIMIVTITSDTDKRLECCNLFCQSHPSTEITGMPDLIHRFKESLETRIKHAMSI